MLEGRNFVKDCVMIPDHNYQEQQILPYTDDQAVKKDGVSKTTINIKEKGILRSPSFGSIP